MKMNRMGDAQRTKEIDRLGRTKKAGYKRILAMMLVFALMMTQLPIGVFANKEQQAANGVKSGIYFTPDGTEYIVMYNDYITVYVNRLDGGYAILPATV